MNILWLFDSCGAIFGSAIMLAGIAAIILCVRATLRGNTRRNQRITIAVATLPFVLGICGFVFGIVFCWIAGVPNISWAALGKVCLAGAVVSVVPLIWALLLYRNRGNTGMPVIVE